jgi:hypothetical protein
VPARIGVAAAAWDDSPVRRGLVALGAGGLAAAVGLVTLRIVAEAPDSSFSGTSALGRTALLSAGWGLVAAGLGSWLVGGAAGRVGPLLAAAGFGWFVLEWNNPGADSALAFTLGLVFFASCPPLVGHAALAYRRGRLASRLERAAVALAYATSLVVLGLLPALFYDPVQEGCNDCPRNLVLVAGRPETVDRLDRIGVWLGAATAFALAGLAAARLVRTRSAVVAAATVYAALVGALYVAWIRPGLLGLWNGPLERRLWRAEASPRSSRSRSRSHGAGAARGEAAQRSRGSRSTSHSRRRRVGCATRSPRSSATPTRDSPSRSTTAGWSTRRGRRSCSRPGRSTRP